MLCNKENTTHNIKSVVYPINGWSSNLIKVPEISEDTVKSFYEKRTSSSRHFNRSYAFLAESYVETHSVKTAHNSTKGLCFVKGRCFKSQKKNDSPYSVTAAIVSATGEILDSNCTCPAGIGGFCNHLVALLRLIVLLKKLKLKEVPESLSCTDLPQQWNRPRCSSMSPTSVMEVDWKRPTEGGKAEPMLCKIYQARKKPRTE